MLDGQNNNVLDYSSTEFYKYIDIELQFNGVMD